MSHTQRYSIWKLGSDMLTEHQRRRLANEVANAELRIHAAMGDVLSQHDRRIALEEALHILGQVKHQLLDGLD